jgi:hypothetical protein
MNLYKITYESTLGIGGFYSPLFYEGKNELEVLGKFFNDCKEHSSLFNPREITAQRICKLKEIRR